jgi:hypothetical protein
MRAAIVLPFACAAARIGWGAPAGGVQPAAKCHARLVVKFSPEVRNPRDPAFLSSFAGDPGFRLIWRGRADMSQTLELVGPGPEYRCMREIDRMRNDARIINLQVIH